MQQPLVANQSLWVYIFSFFGLPSRATVDGAVEIFPTDKAASHFFCSGLSRMDTLIGLHTRPGRTGLKQGNPVVYCNLVQIKLPATLSSINHIPSLQRANSNEIEPLSKIHFPICRL